jgi:hypothetical protein
MRVLTFALALVLLLAPVPVGATTWEPIESRCWYMTKAVNARRTAADIRGYSILCDVGLRRAWSMVRLGVWRHNLGPVVTALYASGICWQMVSEVIAWRSTWTDSTTWVSMWWASDSHRGALTNPRYQWGGGGYTGTGSDGSWPHNVAVYYMLDRC